MKILKREFQEIVKNRQIIDLTRLSKEHRRVTQKKTTKPSVMLRMNVVTLIFRTIKTMNIRTIKKRRLKVKAKNHFNLDH